MDFNPDRPLNIGFVSGDFRSHSVSFFLLPLFDAHDRERLRFFCYSNSRREDDISRRLQQPVYAWRNIASRNDADTAELIRSDDIDILIDLSGHTSGHRLELFCLKPAPIQATWLGYPDTTGLGSMDYRISDAVCDPPGESDAYNVEELVRLPGGFLCYRPPDAAPAVAAAPVNNNGHVTFGSFNNLAKVGRDVVAVWAAILKRTPGSRLLIKSHSLAAAKVRRHYLEMFADVGIEAERLTLLSRTPDAAAHLAKYHAVDIGLDPFPYNGATTTCEAIWMGVPVVVLGGNRHAATRYGALLLTQVGIEELIADDIDEYVDKAVALACDRNRLDQLRSGLRQMMQNSPLCDGNRIALEMEAALYEMWRRRCGDATSVDAG